MGFPFLAPAGAAVFRMLLGRGAKLAGAGLIGGGAALGGAGSLIGGAAAGVGGLAGLAGTALSIGGKVAGAGLGAIGGGAKALGGLLLGSKDKGGTAQQVTPGQGQTVTTTQPNQVKQAQQTAAKSQAASTAKVIKEAKDTSRKSDKGSKNAVGILAAIKSQLEALNQKVSNVISAITSGQKRESRKALESKVESQRQGEDEAAKIPQQSIVQRSKNLFKKTGGFISSVLGLILKYFLVKLGTLALFPELGEQFKEFEKNIVDFFKNGFSALKKLFKGDLEGAKEDGLAAFDNLKGVLKGVAKFASGLVDKVLKFFGFEELNLFDKAEEKAKKIEKKLDEDLGEEGESKSLLQKLVRKFEIFISEFLFDLKKFLTLKNLTDLIFKGSRIEKANEQEAKELSRIDRMDLGSKTVGIQALREESKAGNISAFTSVKGLQKKVEKGKATAGEQAALARIEAAIEAEKEKMRLKVKEKYDKQRADAEIDFFKPEQVQARKIKKQEMRDDRIKRDAEKAERLKLEKKLKQNATGEQLNDASAQQSKSVNIVNAPTNVNKGGDQVVTNNNVSGGGGGASSGTTNPELSQLAIQTTYLNPT